MGLDNPRSHEVWSMGRENKLRRNALHKKSFLEYKSIHAGLPDPKFT